MTSVDNPHGMFYQMCDVIQGVNSTRNDPSPFSIGIKAGDVVKAFAKWFKTEFLPGSTLRSVSYCVRRH